MPAARKIKLAKPKAESRKLAVDLTADRTSAISGLPAGYSDFLEDLKTRIRAAQVKAALPVNRELIELYWHIGRSIVERQRAEGWGKSVVERLSRDVQVAFPGVGGFSSSNIWRMRSFYAAWRSEILSQPARELEGSILVQAAREPNSNNPPQAVLQIPWFHNVVLVERLKDLDERLWYARQTVFHGWSRAVLVHQIETGAYHRSGKAVSNCAATLPPMLRGNLPTPDELAHELGRVEPSPDELKES